jgi:hypothetical protein
VAISKPRLNGGTVNPAKAAILFCLTAATASGSWYLHVWAPDRLWRRTDLAGTKFMDQGRFAEAERQFAAAIHEARFFGDRDPRLAKSLLHQAQALVAQNKHPDAIPLLEQAIMIYQRAHGLDHPETAAVLNYFAQTKATAETGLQP